MCCTLCEEQLFEAAATVELFDKGSEIVVPHQNAATTVMLSHEMSESIENFYNADSIREYFVWVHLFW